ncbi:MAG: hypothetical protein DCC55_29885 [Chloroflexi bacterium]|nr:MAG: hypothetical protein DCC55_29885 [Chloroflexota bacterium]
MGARQSTAEAVLSCVEQTQVQRTEHPHIVRIPGVCGGEPVIENTRISVRLIAGYYKAGMTVEEILRDYPHLAAAAVYDAISYYIDHQAEIEALIEANRIEHVLQRTGLQLGKDGIISRPNQA